MNYVLLSSQGYVLQNRMQSLQDYITQAEMRVCREKVGGTKALFMVRAPSIVSPFSAGNAPCEQVTKVRQVT